MVDYGMYLVSHPSRFLSKRIGEKLQKSNKPVRVKKMGEEVMKRMRDFKK